MAGRKLSAFDRELFIEEIRLHPYLYNRADTQYKDVVFKDNAWGAIGAQFGITKDKARQKWKNLRDRYLRERKLYVEHRKRGIEYWQALKWKAFRTIASFLEPALQIELNYNTRLKRSYDEGRDDDISKVPVESSIIIDDRLLSLPNITIIKNEPNDESVSDMHSASYPDVIEESNEDLTEEVSTSEFKRRRIGDVDSSRASLLATDNESVNTFGPEKRLEYDQSCDDTYYYFSYLMARYRKMTPTQQRFVRRGFDKTMFEVDDLQS